MDEISRQIDLLKSPDKNKRYFACENLRVAAAIPIEAIHSLQEATHDEDSDVADAAKRALAVHGHPPQDKVLDDGVPGSSNTRSGEVMGDWLLSPLTSVVFIFVGALVASSCGYGRPQGGWASSVYCRQTAGVSGDAMGLLAIACIVLQVGLVTSIVSGVLVAAFMRKRGINSRRAIILAQIAAGVLAPFIGMLLLSVLSTLAQRL